VSSHLLKVNDGVSRNNEYPTEKGVDKKNVTQYEVLFWHFRDCMTLTKVVGLVWSNESRSYAGGSLATGRASHARLVRDKDPD